MLVLDIFYYGRVYADAHQSVAALEGDAFSLKQDFVAVHEKRRLVAIGQNGDDAIILQLDRRRRGRLGRTGIYVRRNHLRADYIGSYFHGGLLIFEYRRRIAETEQIAPTARRGHFEQFSQQLNMQRRIHSGGVERLGALVV